MAVGLFDLKENKVISGWIALKHKTSSFGQWCISPKAYFDEYGRIPDYHAKLKVPGMEEVMDHTLAALDDSDGRDLLVATGFEIVDNPEWYFQRPGYVPDE